MLDELAIYNLSIKYPNTIDLVREVERIAKAEAIDEFINTIKPRMKWDNEIYTLAIEHCIEVAEMLKERNK